MRIGQLRHTISIEQASEIRDARGETTQTWTAFKITRAAIYPQAGNEKWAVHQENNSITHKIIIRYQPGILPTMRVNYDGRLFDIQSIINPAELNKSLTLLCQEHL